MEIANIADRQPEILKAVQLASDRVNRSIETGAMQEEFALLTSEHAEQLMRASFKVALIESNDARNRYFDILPYDDTRVVLKGKNDYIHASFIRDVLPGVPVFIAAQGPTDMTVGDFWTMVAQQNVAVLAMVTNLVEGGTDKCAMYWPRVDKPMDIMLDGSTPAKITLVHETSNPVWVTRQLEILPKGAKVPQEVVQLHFTDWPDHGVPADPRNFVKYVRAVMAAQLEMGYARPLLVHCSAGVGRTGTFIGVYAILESLQHMGDPGFESWDILALVRAMRKCRPFMLQSLAQYQFLCSLLAPAVRMYLQSALKANETRSAEIAEATAHLPRRSTSAFFGSPAVGGVGKSLAAPGAW